MLDSIGELAPAGVLLAGEGSVGLVMVGLSPLSETLSLGFTTNPFLDVVLMLSFFGVSPFSLDSGLISNSIGCVSFADGSSDFI